MRPHPAIDTDARRFFLARTPDEGRPELCPEEADHVRRVLRLGPGDELVGLDGRGAAWPLRIEGRGREAFELTPLGPARREPGAGEPGSVLPWIELAVAFPRAGRTEEMLDRLVQLGAAAVTPLVCERSHPQARAGSARRGERLERIARAACKQSGRTWLPELGEPLPLRAWLDRRPDAACCRLDPRAGQPLSAWLRSDAIEDAGTRARPLALVIGPEGGFSPEECAAFDEAHCARARLGPHVLRIATAAEAALAVAAHALARD